MKFYKDFLLVSMAIVMLISGLTFLYFISSNVVYIIHDQLISKVSNAQIGAPIGLAIIFSESLRQFIARFKEISGNNNNDSLNN